MRLARALRGRRGEVLVREGVALQASHIRLLRERDIYLLDVLDGVTDDVEIAESVSEEVKAQSLSALQGVYGILQKSAAALGACDAEQVVRGLNRREFARTVVNNTPIYDLNAAATKLVAEVVRQKPMLTLASIHIYDEYLLQHSVSMATTAVVLGGVMGWPEPYLVELATGCMVHDVGRAFLPEPLVRKRDGLTAVDAITLQRHAALGYEFTKQLFGAGSLVSHVPYEHHERKDGTGYPRGIASDNSDPNPRNRPTVLGQILPMAQVAAVADVYDVLSSDRAWRPALSPSSVASFMRAVSGSMLNASVVERCLGILGSYPAGSEVVLHGPVDIEGHTGVVVRGAKKYASRPVVRVLHDANGRPQPPYDLDLNVADDVAVESTLISTPDAMVPLPAPERTRLLKFAESAAQSELEHPLMC
jgi:HD-GYP domain-containing protein (c-di-GMP phosphodiesterase class II)